MHEGQPPVATNSSLTRSSTGSSFRHGRPVAWFEEKPMLVSEIMTRQVATVRTNEKASTAAQLMWDCDCGALPVLDETGRAVAVVTDRDICMATLFQDRSPSQFPVSLAMSRDLHFCLPEHDVTTAEQRMRVRQIRRLPVLDADRRLVGIISLADIVRATARKKGRKGTLPSDEVTATLLDICASRGSGEVRAGT
jgi:CBS domain-containing protein